MERIEQQIERMKGIEQQIEQIKQISERWGGRSPPAFFDLVGAGLCARFR